MSLTTSTVTPDDRTAPSPPRRNLPLPGHPFATWRADLASGLVVFLVALPLCLGIALASGAPLLAGLITGIVGGVVVAWASGSPLSVSGPAAGLTVIVLGALQTLGTYPLFLTAVVLAGVLQLGFGFLRAGVFGNYFPNTVIKGMLAAIGAILVLKQLPHLVGHDPDPEGDMDFVQKDGENTFTELVASLGDFSMGATLIGVLGLAVLIAWPRLPFTKNLKLIPAPLAVVLLGVLLNQVFKAFAPEIAVSAEHLVSLPVFESPGALLDAITFPDFAGVMRADVWRSALTIAIIASVETLLCVEAVDKLDPHRRVTPVNRELKAQGLGNIVAGLIGGIPMTAVVVRGSANVQAGGQSRLSAFFHGVLLLVAVVLLGRWMNEIPLAALAAVLIHIGYKLTPVSLFKTMARRGRSQLIPFVTTFGAILFTDLLTGVAVGMVVGVGFILHEHLRRAVDIEVEETAGPDGTRVRRFVLDHHVSFLNKAAVRAVLDNVREGERIEIDGTRSSYIDPDVVELIEDFQINAADRGVDVRVIAMPAALPSLGGH